MKLMLISLAVIGGLVSASMQAPPKDPVKPAPAATPTETVVVKAANVKWTDNPSLAGAKMAVASGDPAKGPSVVLLKFPKGMTIPPHWHTSSETITVVGGSAVFGSGEKVDEAKGTELSSGSYILIPGKNPHWAVVKEELVISVAADKAADFNLCGEKK